MKKTIKYNKLVRDRIPEIISAAGKKCKLRRLQGKAARRAALVEKLREETAEYRKEPGIGELADLAEVVEALAALDGFSFRQVRAEQLKKRWARGGFDKGIVLVSVLESPGGIMALPELTKKMLSREKSHE